MEKLIGIYTKTTDFFEELKCLQDEFEKKTHSIMYGESEKAEPLKDVTNVTPQPEKKKPKRLTALDESDETRVSRSKHSIRSVTEGAAEERENHESEEEEIASSKTKQSSHKSKKSDAKTFDVTKSATELMPPPTATATAAVTSSNSDRSFCRPQRTAKLNCEKNLKEPSLSKKLRRPNDENDNVRVKLESENRASQRHEGIESEKHLDSTSSIASQDSVVVLPPKEISTVMIESEVEANPTSADPHSTEHGIEPGVNPPMKDFRIRIKREKQSITIEQQERNSSKTEMNTRPQQKDGEVSTVDPSLTSTVLSTTTANATKSKKARTKKVFPKPIKVERISDVENNTSNTSIASRTRQKERSFEQERKEKEKDKDKGKEKEKEKGKGKKKEKEKEKESLNEDHAGGASIYEEALENMQTSKNGENPKQTTEPVSAKMNVSKPENSSNFTMVIGPAPNDATYCTENAATFVIDNQNNAQTNQVEGSDLTFNVAYEKPRDSQHSSIQSMETARDTQHPDSLMTEDESLECPETPVPSNKNAHPPKAPLAPKLDLKPISKLSSSANKYLMSNKICKMPTRTIEIFNPLVQSPVKKKVEAYENVAAAQAASTDTMRSTRSKQIAPKKGSITTPQLGKKLSSTSSVSSSSSTATLGRFPSIAQSSYLTPNAMTHVRTVAASASKATGLRKSNSCGNLKQAGFSAKAAPRGNSAEDFRRGIHQLAEDRKKQREQKHLLAAQQREAKERERTERMAKVAKEREEKRLKKQKEAEQKKRELEEIQKKLRAQEEAAATEIAKQKAKVLEQEKNMLQKMKAHSGSAKAKIRMPPPASNHQIKYTFDMLHEDDSTDDEDKITYKRPPPPEWSRSHVRWANILMQQVMPTTVIDNFFSVEPMTPDLKIIFPGISNRHLQRNSSVLWTTPPRYSELPKY